MDKTQLLQRVIEYLDEDGAEAFDIDDYNPHLRGFFDELAPSDVEAFYDGVEHGARIAERINAAKSVRERDGTSVPIDEQTADKLVRKAVQNMRTLAEEVGDEELVEMLTVSEYVPRTGDYLFSGNERNGDITFLIGTMGSDIIHSTDATASVMYEAVYTLFHNELLAFYIQWPIYEKDIRTPDPFEPFFALWARGVEFQFATEPGVVEFYYPPTNDEP